MNNNINNNVDLEINFCEVIICKKKKKYSFNLMLFLDGLQQKQVVNINIVQKLQNHIN